MSKFLAKKRSSGISKYVESLEEEEPGKKVASASDMDYPRA